MGSKHSWRSEEWSEVLASGWWWPGGHCQGNIAYHADQGNHCLPGRGRPGQLLLTRQARSLLARAEQEGKVFAYNTSGLYASPAAGIESERVHSIVYKCF